MNTALILSGGMGTRICSEVPKQYLNVGGKPVLMYCVEALLFHKRIDAIQIVAETIWQESILSWLKQYGRIDKFRGFSSPGKNRQLSIYQGLQDIRIYADNDDYVLIHDAARPLLSDDMIERCFEAVLGHDGVVPSLPMKDTVYLSIDGRIVTSLLDRAQLYAGQTPEIFRLGRYYEANKCLLPEKIMKINGSAEPAVMAEMDIVLTKGNENNFKITTKADLECLKKILDNSNTGYQRRY